MASSPAAAPAAGSAADIAAALPFDTEAMVAGIEPWVRCESPSLDAEAVARMMRLVAHELAVMGAQVEMVPGRDGMGPSVRARLPHPDAGAPGVLISGHFDTVHPVGTLARNPFRREADRVYGPGILDMKAGNYIALEALRQLAAAGHRTPLPVTVLFTPDEELGSPTSRALIEAEALRHRYVLCPEPALAGNGVTTGRYAIARYAIETRGTPTHAGIKPQDGASAVREMCRRILEIEAMTDEECTFSVNDLSSGRWVNCVPAQASAQVLSMAKTEAALARGSQALLAAAGTRDGVAFAVRQTVARPLWANGRPETMALFETARGIATALGQPLSAHSSGGGSDANFTGALGIASLCSLGAAGAGMHTLDEHILASSLAERGRLTAGLLLALGR
ncbi:M20/M25/M40 family metallo-hydrolase [Aquibium sp. A9E412]|uniref:M20/M25/M40 family metallo-hydrolase n=1 Tax=Aquibium sp. A9E412 TaxID=2976767 RepID=UPI0025AEEA91|nr:M20/M25/M40 family metallo-hydrolase [Aquibium sp. A9E412]MDN2566944.1 M20/M25/M40 family metallo-hydrolase [Aquibium sp. A9E412]